MTNTATRPDAILVFDFDYTIFDPTGLRDDMAAALLEIGIESRFYHQCYEDARSDAVGVYRPDIHARLIAEHKTGEIDTELQQRIESVWDAVIQCRAADYLDLSELRHLLVRLGTHCDAVILTFGHIPFQQQKIESCGIESLIAYDSITITDNTMAKSRHIGTWLSQYKKVIILNDDVRQNNDFLTQYPESQVGQQLLVVELQRPYKTERRRLSTPPPRLMLAADLGDATIDRIERFITHKPNYL